MNSKVRLCAKRKKSKTRKDEGKRRAEAAAGDEREPKRAKSGDITA
jgi:CTD kinase subunit alpha